MTRKWKIVNDQSNANYDVGNKAIYNLKVLKSNLCGYNDAYILVGGNITIIELQETQVAFKNCPLFPKCVTKIDGTTTNDAEDLDSVMWMDNVIEYSSNYSQQQELYFYSKDEANYLTADTGNTSNFESFMYKDKLLEVTLADGDNKIFKNATIVWSKDLSNFWRSL